MQASKRARFGNWLDGNNDGCLLWQRNRTREAKSADRHSEKENDGRGCQGGSSAVTSSDDDVLISLAVLFNVCLTDCETSKESVP
jgi:hypothetical protein